MSGLFIKSGFNNLFVSKTREMARFGIFMLAKGKWENEQILNSSYYEQLIYPSQDLNKSYGLLWWLNGKESFKLPGLQIDFPGHLTPNAPTDMFSALGKNGQILNIIPSQNLIVIRMGNVPDESEVPILFVNEMWEKLKNITTEIKSESKMNKILYKNNTLKIETHQNQSDIELIDLMGNSVYNEIFSSNDIQISLNIFEKGIYFIKISNSNITEYHKFINY